MLDVNIEKLGYEEGLALKKESFLKDFAPLIGELQNTYEISKSPVIGFRNRAELSIFRENGELFYAMHEGRKKYIIKELFFVDLKIQEFMPRLLKDINESQVLKEKLFAVEFLATKTQLSVTLIYHKKIKEYEEEFSKYAKEKNLNLIIRSRKQKLVFGDEELKQSLIYAGGKLNFTYTNDSFIQPNTHINEAMMSYIYNILKTSKNQDLLELYCGFGNFTLPFARLFDKVLATEISKENIRLANINKSQNYILNVDFIRLSADEVKQALSKARDFYRLKDINLESYTFSHILLDPPRAGLGSDICDQAKDFSNIIYISCNPKSLKEDLTSLLKTHDITHIRGFDQFAFTPHLENILILKKRK